MAPLFPAIFLGGPPHSGKSTLTDRLSQALRQRDIAHYALRASPDGEGDWSSTAPQALVAELRNRAKSAWTPDFATLVSRDVADRHLPLLVDAGGKVSPESAQIAANCTHALLLAANPADLPPWREMVAQQGLVLLAELQSVLQGTDAIFAAGPLLRGQITGLARGLASDGICFATLLDRVASICAYDPNQLYRAHLALTELELVIHVERAIHPLPPHPATNPWYPAELAPLLASLPADEPLGIYGRGPVWVYAALAAFSAPTPQVFDVRQGWVLPPSLVLVDQSDPTRLRWDAVIAHPNYTHLRLSIPDGYLDYRTASDLPVPQVAADQGVVLDGRLPNWLWAALARTYTEAAWIAIYQPQLHHAVVVWSAVESVPPGQMYAIAASDC